MLAEQVKSSFYGFFILDVACSPHILHQFEGVNYLLNGVVPLAHVLEFWGYPCFSSALNACKRGTINWANALSVFQTSSIG